jgi:hypothetical protein
MDGNGESNGLILDWRPAGKQTATVTARLNGDLLACESVNPTKPKQRADFANRLCDGRPDIDRTALDAQLLKMAAELASRGDGKGDEADPEPDRLAAIPQSIRAEARAIL